MFAWTCDFLLSKTLIFLLSLLHSAEFVKNPRNATMQPPEPTDALVFHQLFVLVSCLQHCIQGCIDFGNSAEQNADLLVVTAAQC